MKVHAPPLRFAPLVPLPRVDWLVVHTAAGSLGATAEDVHAYHLTPQAEGGPPGGPWAGGGYHYFVRWGGMIERMRPEGKQGAHARGLNGRSLGICCAGHGDRQDFSDEQKAALAWLLPDLRARHGLPKEQVIGHREIGVKAGAPAPGKSCPGTQVDMEEVRALSDGEDAALYVPDALARLDNPREPETVWRPPIPDPQLILTPRGARQNLGMAAADYAKTHYRDQSALCRAIPTARRVIRLAPFLADWKPLILDLLDAAQDRCERAA